jgi:HB1, ASXL, restriction endonuclease HTH domain
VKQDKRPAQVNAERPKGSFLDAAATILKRGKAPLTFKEITERAIASALLQGSIGKTPDRTMAAALYMEVLHNPASRFRRIAQAGRTRAVRNSVKWTLR